MAFYQARGNYVSQTYDGYTYAFYSVGDYDVEDAPDRVYVEYKEYLSIGCNTPYTSVARGTFYYTHNGVQYSIPDEWYVSSASEEKDVTHSVITILKGTSAKTALFGAGFVSDGTGDFPAGTSSGSINIPIPAITKYTVTFVANGHGTAPAPQSVFYGYKATQPTSPTASGWTFGGWYKEASCTNAWNFNSDTVKGDTKLYAKWTPNAYTITYDANSATSGSAPASQTISYNNDSTLRAVPSGLVKTGHHLNSRTEWNRTSNGTGTSYAAGTVSYKWTTFGSLTASSTTVKLWANWVKDTYTVTYDANGGSGKPSDQTKTYNVPLTLSSTKPTRTGYTFATWSASTGGTCDAGQPFTGNGSSNGATITMTAVWTANTYDIVYNNNGGSGKIDALKKRYDLDCDLSDGTGFTKTGTVNGAFVEYKQTGWNTKADGTGTSYSLGQQIAANTITSGFTLYAIWAVEVIYPTITNFEVYRTAKAGASDLTPVDDGEYLVVHFNYTDCSEDGGTTAITPTCEIIIDDPTTPYTKVLSNGECYYKNSNQYSQDATHAVSVRLYDPNQDYTRSSATASTIVPTATLPIDLYGSGTSVYMGLMHVHVEGQPVTMPVTYVDNLYVDVDTTTQEEPDSSLWTAIHTDLSWF